jgi:hypothetical protein
MQTPYDKQLATHQVLRSILTNASGLIVCLCCRGQPRIAHSLVLTLTAAVAPLLPHPGSARRRGRAAITCGALLLGVVIVIDVLLSAAYAVLAVSERWRGGQGNRSNPPNYPAVASKPSS